MSSTSPTHQSSNLQKHTNPNPIQQWLIGRFHATAAALLAQTDATSVLDAGCGESFGMHHALAAKPWVMGLDASIGALQVAQQLQPHRYFIGGDVLRLPFPNASFDLVSCMEVLEHLPDPSHGLRELCRVTRCWLLLSVPHEPFFRGANFLRGKNVWALGNDPGHLNHWSSRAFVRFVSSQCRVVAARQSFPWTLALCRTD